MAGALLSAFLTILQVFNAGIHRMRLLRLCKLVLRWVLSKSLEEERPMLGLTYWRLKAV